MCTININQNQSVLIKSISIRIIESIYHMASFMVSSIFFTFVLSTQTQIATLHASLMNWILAPFLFAAAFVSSTRMHGNSRLESWKWNFFIRAMSVPPKMSMQPTAQERFSEDAGKNLPKKIQEFNCRTWQQNKTRTNKAVLSCCCMWCNKVGSKCPGCKNTQWYSIYCT